MNRFLVFCLFLFGCVLATCVAKDVMRRAPCKVATTRMQSELDAFAKSWENCEYNGVKLTRMAIVDYFKLGFDLDGDGKLSMSECEAGRNCYFNSVERKFGETCKTVFDRCDCNQDGLITRDDFERSFFTCLKDCEAGRRIYEYIGIHMANNTAFSKCRNSDDSFD